jgi:hypothetical protein
MSGLTQIAKTFLFSPLGLLLHFHQQGKIVPCAEHSDVQEINWILKYKII